ncbi:chemotaxis protein CheA [soil metagenome]
MSSLSDLTEQLAAAVVVADTADLVTLAAVFDHLGSIDQAAGAMAGTPGVDRIQQLAGGTATLVQHILLNEVADADASLREVSRSAIELQKMVEQALAGECIPAVPRAAIPVAADRATVKLFEPAPAVHSDESLAESPCNPDDRQLVLDFVLEASSHIESAEAQLLKMEEEPDNPEHVNGIFRSFHTIKGVAGFLNLAQIGKLAHAAESLLDRAREGKLDLTDRALDLVFESVDAMKRLLGMLEESMKANAVMPAWPALPGLIERMKKFLAGDATPGATPAAATSATATPLAIHATDMAKPASADQTVKVAIDRLDALINHVGELVIAQSMVAQDVNDLRRDNPRLAGNMAHLSKIARELQELSMSMRMVPIAGVFQKMTRLVRDVSRKAGKEIELVLTGKETELDRNVVDAIGDPLVHMIRNACDHGIESPDARVKSGKPRHGRIELKASHQSSNIVIEICDDGKGLDTERIFKKAVAAGVISADQSLSEQDIFKLIFAPGLSTAESITDISGRGVGMDVVKKNIESLRGRVEIASVRGTGSTFTIRLPLTLAVIDGLVVRVGSERYVLPLLSIEQSIRPAAEQLSTVNGRGEMCMVRGMCLPIFRLHSLFDVNNAEKDATKAIVVIVQDNDRRCCLMVDELLGQEQVVIKSLGDSMDKISGIHGGAILGDGQVSLILDVASVMDLAAAGSKSAAKGVLA